MERNREFTLDKKDFTQAFWGDIEVLIDKTRVWQEPTIKMADEESKALLTDLMKLISGMDLECVSRSLPQLSEGEILSRTLKMVLDPLRKVSSTDPFGSRWNEWTLCLAGREVDIPREKVLEVICEKSEVGNKLRMIQGELSRLLEEDIKSELTERDKKKIGIWLAMESWLNLRIGEVQKETGDIAMTKDILIAFIQLTDFVWGVKLPAKRLFQLLTAGRKGKKIDLMDLHCLSFTNSQTDGINVVRTAEDFVRQEKKGNRELVSQRERLEGVWRVAGILKQNNIIFEITVLIIDNDQSVDQRQEDNIREFVASLKDVIKSNTPDGLGEVRILLASDLFDWREHLKRWDDLSEKTQENEVDTAFAKLQSKNLPNSHKSRMFARDHAHKVVAVDWGLGETLSKNFDNLICVRRTRAIQQAAKFFTMGQKTFGSKEIVLIPFWKEIRKV